MKICREEYGSSLCKLHSDSPAALSGDIMGRLVTGATSSDDHMRILRQWLDDCQANHQECRLTLSGSQVLDVENASPQLAVLKLLGEATARGVFDWLKQHRDAADTSRSPIAGPLLRLKHPPHDGIMAKESLEATLRDSLAYLRMSLTLQRC